MVAGVTYGRGRVADGKVQLTLVRQKSELRQVTKTVRDDKGAERVEEALQLAAAAGVSRSDLALSGAAEVYELYHRGGIVSAELYSFLSAHLADWIATLDRRVRQRMEAGAALPAWDYLQRKDRYAALGAAAAAALQDVDALVCPTVPISPPQSAHAAQHLCR